MSTALPERRAVVAALLAARGDLLVVSGLGGTTWDVAAAGDDPANAYLWGAMGLAVPTGLGLALAQPARRVLVVTGDGEMLMGLGSLATVARARPANLAIVVIDNERYGETGGQRTHTAAATDLAAVARGAGLAASETLRDLAAVTALRARIHGSDGPLFAVVKVAPGNGPMVLPPRDGALLQHRFRAALGVDQGD
ncbi:MAG: aldehyde dehydrogenase [Gammaproteobacteria bacterium]|nr:aldehyde dehydrogenase [Gammaproteobacteria bacterium]